MTPMKSLRRVAVYCGSADGNHPAFLAEARALGKAVAQAGMGVVYGGANVGLMGAMADAVEAQGLKCYTAVYSIYNVVYSIGQIGSSTMAFRKELKKWLLCAAATYGMTLHVGRIFDVDNPITRFVIEAGRNCNLRAAHLENGPGMFEVER